MHITLKFLGECASWRGIDGVMDTAFAGFSPFPIRSSGLSAFRAGEYATLVLSFVPNNSLNELYRGSETAFEPLGFPKERRAFRPHITIARKISQESPYKGNSFPDIVVNVQTITLYESKRINGALKYIPLFRVPLKSMGGIVPD